MPKAIWNGAVIAEADRCEKVEGNWYFPSDCVNREYFRESDEHSECPWKGTASYYDIVVGGQVNKGAAWCYPAPKQAANRIKGHIAFWRDVVTED